MRDLLPDEVELRDAVAATLLGVYRRHGFRRVETPALEHIQLLTRGEGGENEKLIFKVLKRGERLDLARATSEADLVDLGLRFDLTVPLARYYAHNHARLPHPLKAVQIGPVWRAERPQRGRYRQFTQCDIDILGVRSEVAEIELILATTEALGALGLDELTVRVNDRRILVAMARRCGFDPARADSVFIALDKWDRVGPEGVALELHRAGHPADAVTRMIDLFAAFEPGQGIGWMRERLADPGTASAFDALGRVIRTVEGEVGGKARILFDARLVRGMAYYTGPIFEVQSPRFPSALAGGGRYDAMIGKLLGREVPATGFSIGFERVVALLVERPDGLRPRDKRLALLYEEPGVELGPVLRAARELRAEGFAVSLEARARNRGAQLQALAAHGFDGVAELDPAGRAAVRWFQGPPRRAGSTGTGAEGGDA